MLFWCFLKVDLQSYCVTKETCGCKSIELMKKLIFTCNVYWNCYNQNLFLDILWSSCFIKRNYLQSVLYLACWMREIILLLSYRGCSLHWSSLSPLNVHFHLGYSYMFKFKFFMLTFNAGRDACIHLQSWYITSRFVSVVSLLVICLDFENEKNMETRIRFVWSLSAHGN